MVWANWAVAPGMAAMMTVTFVSPRARADRRARQRCPGEGADERARSDFHQAATALPFRADDVGDDGHLAPPDHQRRERSVDLGTADPLVAVDVEDSPIGNRAYGHDD